MSGRVFTTVVDSFPSQRLALSNTEKDRSNPNTINDHLTLAITRSFTKHSILHARGRVVFRAIRFAQSDISEPGDRPPAPLYIC